VGDPVGYDSEHIWLRQSVSETSDGQTRTMEIAVSLRPGMTASQIEALLKEADAGMQRLSHHLSGCFALPQTRGIEPVEQAAPDELPVSRPSAGPDPDQIPPTAQVSPSDAPLALVPPPPVPPPAAAAWVNPSARAEAISVKDFVAAVRAELDLSPKQAMDRLHVRSLNGLDLNEALDALRRQMGREGEQTVSSPTQAAQPPAVPAPPRYFEEEEDEGEFEVTLSLDEDSDEFDLEDVPDFDAVAPHPRAVATPSVKRPVPAKSAPAANGVDQGSPAESAAAGQTSTTLELIGQLRATAKGSTPTSHQRTAYRNIILRELGEQPAKALVAGLWHVPAERLGADQMDALLSWGKRDTFGEEATLVLAALRTEREQKGATPASGGSGVGAAGSPPTGSS
jgi:hypothetical protein